MKMKQFLTIALTFNLLSCSQPNRVITKDKIYEFVNDLLERQEIPHFKGIDKIADKEFLSLSWSNEDSITILKMDSIFNLDDVEFISRQIRESNNFGLEQRFIKNKKIISIDTLKQFGKLQEELFWIKLKQKYGNHCFATISKSVFSRDKLKVVVRLNYYSEFGGNGETLVFRKHDGKWDVVTMLGFWDN